MSLSKQQKTKVITSLALSFLFLIGILIALYYIFLSLKIDHTYFVVLAIIIILATSIGFYIGIRRMSAGKDIYSCFELGWKDRDAKIMFWFISPLIFFVFFYIYLIPVVFLTWLFSLPFGSAADQYSDLMYKVDVGICLLFALFTLLWLWRLLKRNSLNKIIEA
jgi:hypothetical protein